MPAKLNRLCSVVLPVPPGQLERVKKEYAAILGEPTLCSSGNYYSFDIDGCELQLASTNITPKNHKHPIAYWYVDDIKQAVQDLTKSGKLTTFSGITPDPEPDSKTLPSTRASVTDDALFRGGVFDYANVTGVVTNPPFLKHRRRTARWATALGLAAGAVLLPRLLTWLRAQ